jgi:chromosome segregation ATPase
MVEPAMYLAIGFLVAMLLGLTIVPLVHNRAVRLTTRRMEAATPLSMAEIQADKDQLRAEFAMSARRLEMNVDQLKHKTTSQLAELGKKTDAINRMKLELGEKNATIFALEAREKAVKEQLRATEEEFAAKTEALRLAEKALTDKQSELARINSELNDRTTTAETRKVELVAVNTQIDALKNRVGDAEKDFAATQVRLEHERSQSEAVTRDLGDARGRVENLSQRVTDLDRQLIVQVKEAELLGTRVNDLEGRLATQGKLLAERDYEVNQLRQGKDVADRTIKELRDEITLTNSGSWPALDKLKSEKSAVEEQLRVARDERSKLQRDINGECALARAHQRHRRRSGETRDPARGTEFADRGLARGRACETCERRGVQWRGGGRRRHARRTHPRAASPRLPRPPGGVRGSSFPRVARRHGRA